MADAQPPDDPIDAAPPDPPDADVDWDAARRALVRDLVGSDGFILVFLLTLLALFLLQAGNTIPGGELSAFAVTLVALGLALQRARILGWWLRTALVVGLVAVGTSALRHVVDDPDLSRALTATGSGLFALFVLVTLPAVLGSAFGQPRVTLNTVAATLTAFLLLGILFTAVLRTVDLATDEPLFTDAPDPTVAEVTYFSFVTLTTLGYGDLTPDTDLGRAVATLEAITGQVYLVTAVALTVSRLGQRRETADLLRQATAERGAAPGPD